MTTVAVTQNPENVIEERVLAESIVKIGAGLANLQQGGLNKRAIIALLYDLTKVPKKQIEAIINGIQSLKSYYTVPISK
jgi:hypothetical protein